MGRFQFQKWQIKTKLQNTKKKEKKKGFYQGNLHGIMDQDQGKYKIRNFSFSTAPRGAWDTVDQLRNQKAFPLPENE